MDLGTVESLIRSGEIKEGIDLVRLVTRVVTNALTYNTDSDHVVHQEALVLRRVLAEEFEKAKRKLEKVEGKRVVDYSESDRKFWREQHERVEEKEGEEAKKRNR